MACSDDGSESSTTTTSEPRPTTSTTLAVEPPPSSAAADAEPELVVGFAGPGPGVLSRLATGQWRGLQLAIEDINAAGGVLGGPVAAVRAEAAAGQTDDEQLAALVADGADTIVGPIASAGAADFIGVTGERALVACSASATSPSLTNQGGNAEVFFRTALRDDHTARHVADAVMEPESGDAPQRVMLIGRDDVYGNELTVDLAVELTARGADVLVEAYPPRRVSFVEEAAAVAAANPDLVVMMSFGEAPRLLADVVRGGYPADRIVGLDGFFVPAIATQAFPSDPNRVDGLTVIATAGDRALLERLQAVPANDDQVSYGAQMYDCVVTLALAAAQAGSAAGVDIGAHVRSVTAGGRSCSSYGDCAALLASGEDIDFNGTTGGIAIDEAGDITSARIVTSVLRSGELREVSTKDLDLTDIDLDALHASAVFATQVQQLLRLLGYLDGDVTGVFDEATVAALRALQRDLGVPETGEFDEATEQALQERAGALADGLSASVVGIQRALAEAGFFDGPIDGVVSPAMIDAIRAMQRELGVPETGVLDTATLRALYARRAETEVPDEPEPATTPPPTTPPPTTPAPTTQPPATQPPATQPPATEPPATQPPATEPPATEPPATDPPPTEPPATEPPATDPPPTEPPATEPPDTEAPVTEAPVTEAPVTEPPVTEPEPEPEPTGMFAVLAADPRFSTLVELLRAAGYDGDLGQPGRLTFFAPTNDAFAGLPSIEVLRADPEQLSAVLAYHLLEGVTSLDQLEPGPHTTVHGAPVEIERDEDGTVRVGGARVVEGDLSASNGVIHAIDQVLTPPG